MGTLSQSIKKIKSMEEELFTMRLHLDNLRIKLKNKNKYFIGTDIGTDSIVSCSGFRDSNDVFYVDNIAESITLKVPPSTFEESCPVCNEIIPNFCAECGKKVYGTKNIVYGMKKYTKNHCLNCYWNKVNKRRE